MVNSEARATAALDTTFAALSDATRRGILARLSLGECNAGELAAPFEVSLPAISRHLKVLEKAGLLDREKRGREHRCRLRGEPLGDAVRWISHYRRFWEERLDALDRYLRETEGHEQEEDTWPPPPRRKPGSGSSVASKRRGKGSSKPGRSRQR